MTQTESHVTKIITWTNGGAKARRYRCSCGDNGPRIAYGPMAGGRTLAAATAKAERTAAEHTA